MKRHIPNLITSLNLLTGTVGIIWVFQENVNDALIFIIIAGKYFMQLAEQYGKSKWGYAALGIISYYGGAFYVANLATL